MLTILGLIASAIAVGAVVYLAVKLTVSAIKTYRKRKTSKLLAASVGDLIKGGYFSRASMDDLDDDDIILAEYDLDEDELVQDISISHDAEEKVQHFLKSNGGIVVFD